MKDDRPYVKRINLGIDTRNPRYKRAYEYICQHKNSKFRFICDCVLHVMENEPMTIEQTKNAPETVPQIETTDLLTLLSSKPEVLTSLAQAVAQLLPNAVQEEVQEIEITESNENEPVFVTKQNEVEEIQKIEEPKHADPNEEEKETSEYDGPVIDFDMLAGISAWDEMLE